jgi:RNA polymerase sigma factor (sigma-70 family)
LINRLKYGDEQDWQDFFLLYRNVICDLGTLRGLTKVECDDLVQEVMRKFFLCSRDFEFKPEIARFRTYFSRIVGNSIVDIKRRREGVNLPLDDMDFVSETETPDEFLDAALSLKWHTLIRESMLQQLKTKISPENYELFKFHVLEQNSVIDTVRKLGVSPARIYLVKSRGVKFLRRQLEELSKEYPHAEMIFNEI